MSECCANVACEYEKLRTRQRLTLKAVLAINLGMFFVELAMGLFSGSTALVGDSLDMLGDALVCGFSLYIVARSDAWKALSAMIKGGIMGVSGLLALAYAGYKFLHPGIPPYQIISLIALFALLANSMCLLLLRRHRQEDINMRSIWLCSRNDMIANLAVLSAAFGVWLAESHWPDLIVGCGIAVLFLRSAFHTIRQAISVYTAERDGGHDQLVAEPVRSSSD
ncbi:MAG TPA: cation diffusion facilitator family transporter [Methylococcaceae bacterium]|nr:cation diffusion facilitator family transporter [Methylococcaceae bacterium]